jgi:outer membrane lipase/esterase
MLPGEALAQAAPSVSSITFSPASIASGTTTTMTVALGNPNATAATLTAALTDTLPPGLTVANGTVGGSCTAAAVTATTGTRVVSYANGATIPAGGCAISVAVTGTSTTANTYYTNTIPAGALQTNEGNSAAAASGTLAVHGGVTVPNVVGLSQAAATNALQAAGLVVGAVTHGPSPGNIPYNDVFNQTPAAGATATAGSAVALSISTGAGGATNPNAPLTSVPGFVDPTQQSVAAALERVCAALQTPGATLTAAQRALLNNCTAILDTYGGGVNAAGLKQALNAVSGKQATAQTRTGVEFSGTQFTNIGQRLAALRQGASGFSLAGLDLGLPTSAGLSEALGAVGSATGYSGPSLGDFLGSQGGGGAGDTDSGSGIGSRLGFFINGSLRRGTHDTTDEETGFDFRSNGVTAGADYRLTDHLVLGAAFGHSSGTTGFFDENGRLDSRDNSGSLYGTYYDEAFYTDFIATYGHISYDASRTNSFSINPAVAPIPDNCSDDGICSIDTSGSTGAKRYAFAMNVGYSFHDRAWVFGPDAALNYSRINVGSMTESDSDGSGMALQYADQTGESLVLKAGGHVSYAIGTPIAVILPEARIHYVHEFKDDQREVDARFLEDPTIGTPNGPVGNFFVLTDPPDRNYLDWAAGVSAQFPYGIVAFIDYSSIDGLADIRTHELSFGLRVEWPRR